MSESNNNTIGEMVENIVSNASAAGGEVAGGTAPQIQPQIPDNLGQPLGATQPSEAELLAFYRYKEKMREEAMLADPLLPIKSALTESNLEKREQLALLEKIQEIQERSGMKNMDDLVALTKNFVIPEYISSVEQTKKNNDISEAVNFKWAIDAYGEWGRKALGEFKAFAREQWGDATPEYMRHDLFRERFPAFIEKNLGERSFAAKQEAAVEKQIEFVRNFREKHKKNTSH